MKPLLIVYLDALIDSYVSQEKTPFIHKLAKQHSFAKITPMFAYTGVEVAVMTGKTADESNVWARFKRGDELAFIDSYKFLPRKVVDYILAVSLYRKGYSFLSRTFQIPLEKLKYFSPAMKESPCLRKDSFFASTNFVYFSYPLLIKNKKVKLFPRVLSDEKKVDLFLKHFDKEIPLYWIQLVELDKVQHEFGVSSQEAFDTAKRYDRLTERMVTEFKKVFPDGDILLFSDHEFEKVKGEVVVPLTQVCFLDSTMARYWDEKPEISSHGHFLSDAEKKKYHIPLSQEWGEHIFVADVGYVIRPNFWNKKLYKGMHGYLPEQTSSHPVCITTKLLKKDMLEMQGLFEVISQ